MCLQDDKDFEEVLPVPEPLTDQVSLRGTTENAPHIIYHSMKEIVGNKGRGKKYLQFFWHT